MTQEPRRSMDDYGPEEMAIPEWRLTQKVGGDWAKQLGAKPGQFYNKISDEIADELNIVVVDIKIGRAKWGTEISDAGPICASMDARSNINMYGQDCQDCPDRVDMPWSLEATERRTKCCLNYTILGIDLEHDYLPVMIRAHGKSALAARELITQLKMNRALRGEYYKAVVNIKSQEKNTPYGITYTLHPKITNLITDESKAEELKAESNRLLGAPIFLPEGRPEEDLEPLGFTPDGTPFYSEEQKQKLSAPVIDAAPKPKEQPVKSTPVIAPKAPPKQKTELPKEEKKEELKKEPEPLDLNF